MIELKTMVMVNNQDNIKQTDSTSESSQENNNQSSQQPTSKKNRFKFEEKDMCKIKHNF